MEPTSRPHATRTRRAVLVLGVALLAVACARTGGGAGPADPPGSGASPIVVTFSPAGDPVTLDNGWVVQHCEGEAPFLCVTDGHDTTLGTVEYASYPPSDRLAAAWASGNVVQGLVAQVDEQHRIIAADRAQGCGQGYEYRAEPVTTTTIGGEPAAVYAFSGVVDGREVERTRAYHTFHAGQLWIVSASASDPAGCMASDLVEFTPADLTTFEPYLQRIVAGSELPPEGQAVVDGIVVGIDGGLDGGLLYLLWDGGKQRIQQPRAMTEDDVAALGLARGPALASLEVTDRATGSFFAVVPPDGPQARLHVVVDGVIREVAVQQVAADVLEGVRDLDVPILTRVRAGS